MRVQRSFDLFDTLAGRLHCHPQCIFDFVEKEFPFSGFRFYRSIAELQSNGTLLDIYKRLQISFGLSSELASDLMQFEFEIELRQVFPILENLNAVQDGDLVVSDTYYDVAQIKQILRKISLNKNVEIYATPCGKGAGFIWDKLKSSSISFHVGDNVHTDVNMPRSRGIEAFHYVYSGLSIPEQIMVDLDQNDLAYLMRAIRLQNPFSQNSLEFLTWEEQCQLNIPLLISSCVFLDAFCKKHKKRRVLFTARDGCLWIQLFRVLYPEYDSIYFHASRFTYSNPSPSFVDYVQKLYTDDSMIVDVQGKGFTCERFFLEYLKCKPCYLAIVNTGKKHHAIFRSTKKVEKEHSHTFKKSMERRFKTVAMGSDLEKINADLVGALYDVQDGKPLRADPEYDPKWIQPCHLSIEKCVELLPYFEIKIFDKRVVHWAIHAITSERVLKHVRNISEHIHLPSKDPRIHLHILSNGSLYSTSI